MAQVISYSYLCAQLPQLLMNKAVFNKKGNENCFSGGPERVSGLLIKDTVEKTFVKNRFKIR